MTMGNAPGWQPDPERDDQERYWDGSAWTDRVRPTAAGGAGSLPEPEHAADLHRALSAATADIDAVEARLSTMFERTGRTTEAGPSPVTSSASTAAADDGVGDDDAAAFAELDAALVAEEADDPEEPGKGNRKLFRRRRKGAPS
jgi:hypothetical protein